MQDDLFARRDKLQEMYSNMRSTVMIVVLYDSQKMKAKPFRSMIVRLSNKIGGDHESRAIAVARTNYFGKQKIKAAYARYADPITDLGCTRCVTK